MEIRSISASEMVLDDFRVAQLGDQCYLVSASTIGVVASFAESTASGMVRCSLHPQIHLVPTQDVKQFEISTWNHAHGCPLLCCEWIVSEVVKQKSQD